MTERMLYGMYSSWVRNDYCVISILTLFIVIAASRPVNKNVNTGAVIRAKPCTDRDGRS